MTLCCRICFFAAAALLVLKAIAFENAAITTPKNDTKLAVQRISSSAGPSRNGTVVVRRYVPGQKHEPPTAGQRPRAAGFATNVGIPPISYGNKYGAVGVIGGPGVVGMGGLGGIGGAGGVIPVVGVVGGVGGLAMQGPSDFNPALLGGIRGYPGIKIRANQRAFQYASALARQILDREICRARLPDLHQRIEQVPGQVSLYNVHVSNYRPPRSLQIYPAPPNLIVIRVEDFDVGVMANLDGIAFVILPIKLFGIVRASFYHISITITLAVERSPYGTPYVVVCGCNVNVPYADVCIQCGGLVGDLINLFLRRLLSERVRAMVPDQICQMLPQVINQRVNPLLARIPQSIPFTQIASMFTRLLGPTAPAYCYSPQCQARTTTLPPPPPPPLPPSDTGLAAPPPNNPPAPTFDQDTGTGAVSGNGGAVGGNGGTAAIPAASQAIAPQSQPTYQEGVGTGGAGGATAVGSNVQPSGYGERRRIVASGQPLRKILISPSQSLHLRPRRQANNSATGTAQSRIILQPLQPRQQIVVRQLKQQQQLPQNAQGTWKPTSKRDLQPVPSHPSLLSPRKKPLDRSVLTRHNPSATTIPVFSQHTIPVRLNGSVLRGVPIVIATGYGGPAGGFGPGGAFGVHGGAGGFGGRGGGGLCAGCPPEAANDPFGAIRSLIAQQIDFRKLSDLLLTVQLLRAYATPYSYDLDLNGEFSPNGRGGTPFGPFPMQWPTPIGGPMIEIMISDFTINSLLYWMHRRNFLSFRIGPQTPGIGPLLTTTCESGEDYSAEEPLSESLRSWLVQLRERRRHRHHHQQRSKRQANGGGGGGLANLGDLTDLGVCIGDIMPAIREKYPNRTLAIVVHTARAPSIMLSGRGGGAVQLDLVLYADFYLEGTNIRVGTITVTALADVALRIMGNRIVGNASLPVLRLIDRDNTLGLEQETFDNLANLAKDMIVRAVNQQLNKGMVVSLPASNLPVNIINPQIRILNHALYIGADFTVAPSALQMIST